MTTTDILGASMKSLHQTAICFFLLSTALFSETLTIPQVADGGGWQTTFVVTNSSGTAGTASISFFMDVGGGADLPWNLSLKEISSTQNIPISAGATVILHSAGTATNTTSGWATMTTSPGVVAYAIFTQRVSGRQDQDGTAPAAAGSNRFLVPFDNTSNFVTTIAFVNLSATTESIVAAFRTTTGGVTQATLPTIPAGGHVAFAFPQQFSPTAGQSGLAEFYSSSGTFAVIALRFNPSGGFTAAPVYAANGAPIIVTGTSVPPIALQGKTFNLTGTLSIPGHDLGIYMQGYPSSATRYSFEFDDAPSSASGISFAANMAAQSTVEGNTVTLTGLITSSFYLDSTNSLKLISANITAATITITFTTLTIGAPLSGTVNFTISGLQTPSTTVQGTFSGTLNRID